MFVPPVTPAHASATAMELGQRLIMAIEAYRQEHPGTDAADVQMALRIASRHSGGAAQRAQRIAIILGLTLLAGLLFFWFGLQR